MPPTNHQPQPAPRATTSHVQTLAGYEAQAIANEYAQLAHRKGWIPMRWGWF